MMSSTTNTSTTPSTTTTTTTVPRTAGKTWVAFGETGALASIHSRDIGYEVRALNRGAVSGTFPTLEIAKAALRGHHSGDVEFTEH